MKKILGVVLLIIGAILIAIEFYFWGCFLIIISVFFFSKKKEKKVEEKIDRNDIGMYNMLLSKKYGEKAKTGNELYKYLELYNYPIALAFQGRLKELQYYYRNELPAVDNEVFKNFMKAYEKTLIKTCIAIEKLEISPMNDLKIGETTGEWLNRKIPKRKQLMNVYNEINDYDFVSFYEKKIKNNPYIKN
ncbi:MAG: hypothetical protein IMY72_11840 [Bacteroidetes bacterium]|nr:hypothetical protein [Bacteroidota bacterium]